MLFERAQQTSDDCAAGLDGWTIKALKRLPDSFWDRVTQLWNSLVENQGEILHAWLAVKVVLLPKPEGGRRPISVTSAFWRILLSSHFIKIGGMASEMDPPRPAWWRARGGHGDSDRTGDGATPEIVAARRLVRRF